jgi:hypothetical protein
MASNARLAMIFAQTNRYGKRRDAFSSDNRQVAGEAHAQILRAVILHSAVTGSKRPAATASKGLELYG